MSATLPRAATGRVSGDVLIGTGLTAGLLAVAFLTAGGVDQTTAVAANTWTEIVLTLLGGALVVAVVLCGARGRAWGAGAVGLMAALTALTALSIIWSVVPDTSWSAANQLLSYLAVFAGAASLARLLPGRWAAVLGAMAVLAAALSGWALLAKVFPATLASGNIYGRLQAPFGYYNAVGVSGALGLPAALWAAGRRRPARWAAGRRRRGALIAGLTAPAMTLMLSAVVLSFSRSADAVAAIGIIGWLAFVPLRLRSVTLLAVGSVGAAVISAYSLSTAALTDQNVAPAAQDAAGHTFGIVIVIVLAVVTAAAIVTAQAMDRVVVAPETRRRIGTILVVLACLIPLGAVGAVATSSRGLTGQISHAWNQLTSTHAVVLNNPGRVFQFGSSRPLYWHEGIDVGEHALVKGVGASGFGTARLRYTSDAYIVDQAHSYVFETFADLGLIGLAVSFALLIAWAVAAARPIAVGARWRALSDKEQGERAGMVALVLIVIAFGVQSTLDWTWYFPGVSIPVLLCAGWLAGRGPLGQRVGWQGRDALPPRRDASPARRDALPPRRDALPPRRSMLDRPGAAATVAGLAALALGGAWMQWQPLRSAQSYAAALSASTNAQAFEDARAAIDRDPLAVQPRFLLASLYQSVKDLPAARAQLATAVRVQPENPVTWSSLGTFEAQIGLREPAIYSLRRMLMLDHTPDATATSAFNTVQRLQIEVAKAKAGG